MGKELIIRPDFKDSKDEADIVIHQVDENHIVKEIWLNTVTKELGLKIIEKPEEAKPKKKEAKNAKKTMPRK